MTANYNTRMEIAYCILQELVYDRPTIDVDEVAQHTLSLVNKIERNTADYYRNGSDIDMDLVKKVLSLLKE